jgi:hypothetical protein
VVSLLEEEMIVAVKTILAQHRRRANVTDDYIAKAIVAKVGAAAAREARPRVVLCAHNGPSPADDLGLVVWLRQRAETAERRLKEMGH